MNNKRAAHSLFKSIGFLNYDEKFKSTILKDKYKNNSFSDSTSSFLNNSYHSEFTKIMFDSINNYSVNRFIKKFGIEIEVPSCNSSAKIENVEIFCFNDSYTKDQTAIFSINYSILKNDLNEISNITNALRNYDCEIIYKKEKFLLKEFVSKKFLCEYKFYDNNSPIEQFSGNKFKSYLILNMDKDIKSRDNLLYELGSFSKIGSIDSNDNNAPSPSYFKRAMSNKISCFNNYDCLTLLNSFTVIGNNNYEPENKFSYTTWNDIYFSIYVINLYIKSTLQIILNDFPDHSVSRRKEFLEFYNKYIFKKISFNFLPNEIFDGVAKSLEIDHDLEYIEKRIDSLAMQISEKNQKQQEFLLLCISVLALLETPLHIEGIREIIGISNMVIYNSIVYPSLIITVITLIILKFRNKI